MTLVGRRRTEVTNITLKNNNKTLKKKSNNTNNETLLKSNQDPGIKGNSRDRHTCSTLVAPQRNGPKKKVRVISTMSSAM